MEYRSMPTHVYAWPCNFPVRAGRTLLDRDSCNISISAITSKWLSLFLRTFLPDHIVAVRPIFLSQGAAVEPIILSPDLSCSRCECPLGKFRVQSHHRRSSGRSTSRQIGMHMAVMPCQFTRKGQLYATVQIGNEVVEVLVVFSRKRGFQLRVRQRRGIDERLACCPPAAEPPRKQTCNRRTLVFWHNCVSVALSFRQTVHVTKKSPCSQHSSCMCIFSREWHIQRREKGAEKSRSQPLQSRNARARAQTKREVRQEKETAAETSQSQKERKKERNSETGKGRGTVRKMPQEKANGRPRGTLSRLALRRDRTSPWWFWKVCDFDVTGSCDVISPDHFVRGFYYSSFRRCGLNFLVLQKG